MLVLIHFKPVYLLLADNLYRIYWSDFLGESEGGFVPVVLLAVFVGFAIKNERF